MTSREERAAAQSTPTPTRRAVDLEVSLREPIGQMEMLGITPTAAADEKNAQDNIDDVVRQLIIHDDRPIENLPPMSAPELKLIGRCVSLSVRQTINGEAATYYYTGLVCAVTAAAVTLMHVNRYTSADFAVYRQREKKITKAGAEHAREAAASTGADGSETAGREKVDSSEAHLEGNGPGLHGHGYTSEGEVGVGKDGALTGHADAAGLMRLDAAGSLAPAVTMRLDLSSEFTATATTSIRKVAEPREGDAEIFHSLKGLDEEDEAKLLMATSLQCQDGADHRQRGGNHTRPKDFRHCASSVGPLPYVSFLRKSIHEVAFGRDPRSSFYSLFEDPSKEMVDMQYLRMFVRRYLVHTGEGNNPRQVPMYAFVTVRGACPSLDRELAQTIVREELPTLMKADRDIERDRKRQRNREIRRDLEIQEYHAPPGLFSDTGILFLTRIPQSTLLSAIIIAFFTVAFAIFTAVSLGVVADRLMLSYYTEMMSYFIAALVVWIVAAVAIGLHAMHMHVPLRDNMMLMGMRLLLSAASVACCVMVVVVLLSRLSTSKLREMMGRQSANVLCRFYESHACSGMVAACTGNVSEAGLCDCPTLFSTPCFRSVWGELQIIAIPQLVFCILVFLGVLHSVFQFLRLWMMVRAIGSNTLRR